MLGACIFIIVISSWDWSPDHYVVSIFVSCNGLHFKVCFVWYECCFSCFLLVSISMNKCLLISWPQSLSLVILEPKKINSVIFSIFSPSWDIDFLQSTVILWWSNYLVFVAKLLYILTPSFASSEKSLRVIWDAMSWSWSPQDVCWVNIFFDFQAVQYFSQQTYST